MISSSIFLFPLSLQLVLFGFTLYVFIAFRDRHFVVICVISVVEIAITHKSPLILLTVLTCFNRIIFIIQIYSNVPHDRAWLVVQFIQIHILILNINILKRICRKANLRNLLLKWILFGIIGAGERENNAELLKFRCWRFYVWLHKIIQQTFSTLNLIYFVVYFILTNIILLSPNIFVLLFHCNFNEIVFCVL